jgi:WD40 repeat protein
MRALLITFLSLVGLSAGAQSELIPRFSIAGDTLLQLSHRWTRMGDENGIFDTPTDNVSVENGQFSRDETRIATVSKGDFTVRLFQADNGDLLWKSDGGQETECLAFTADDQYIVTGGEGNPEINIWAASTGAWVRSLAPVGTSVEGMAFSPDFSRLACGNEGGQVLIYQTSDPDLLNWPDTPALVLTHGIDRDLTGIAADGHSDVNQLEWTSDGRLLLSAGRNGLVQVWQASDFTPGQDAIQPLRTLAAGSRGSLKSLDLSLEDDLVASCNNWRTGTNQQVPVRVVVHEIATGEIVFDYAIPGARVPENVTFDPSGQIMMSGCDFIGIEEDQARTYIWRTDAVRRGDTEPSQTIDWFEQEYFDFSDAADRLVVSGNDGSVRVFDVEVDTTSSITTSTRELSSFGFDLEVFPNPTTNQMVIHPKGFAADRPIILSLYDLQGQLILQDFAHGEGQQLLVLPASTPPGPLLLVVQQGATQISKRVVVTR